jgi:BirA family biotin operon repressor/biotin-[acetyl-CoA-carboxylase] ligase
LFKNTNSLRPENPIGKPFFELGEVDSSNNYAMQQVQAQMAEHGTTYFASFQNKGKGQRGKPWNGEYGQNIMMSCVLEPGFISLDNQFFLNIAIALGCYEFFEKYAIDKVSIKWPNDIYWADRKAGGILIENILQGREWKYSIAGIGININQTLFPPSLPNPVSLKQITGKTFEPLVLAKDLCSFLEKYWQLLKGNPSNLLKLYNERLYKKNQLVYLKSGESVFTAEIKGVNERGELLIFNGMDSAITFGTVEWVLPQLK